MTRRLSDELVRARRPVQKTRSLDVRPACLARQPNASLPALRLPLLHSRGRRSRLVLVAAASVVLGLTGATHPALARDLRSPDARDAATLSAPAPVSQTTPPRVATDLRSPDVRDVAGQARPRIASDLRSPDTSDLTRPRHRVSPAPASASDGFDWIYLTVGGLAVGLLVAAGEMTRRARRRVKHAPAVLD